MYSSFNDSNKNIAKDTIVNFDANREDKIDISALGITGFDTDGTLDGNGGNDVINGSEAVTIFQAGMAMTRSMVGRITIPYIGVTEMITSMALQGVT